ncbi:amino acid adenylation domain-containing protein [Streptomyces sp. LZ34]
MLSLPRGLAVNFHDALLPRHAGVHATTWAVLEGERRHGVTWHVMTEEADAGDVLVQREVDVADDETSHTLNVKCLEAGVASFAELIAALAEGRAERRPQDLSRRGYHGRYDRPPGGGFLAFDRPAEELAAAVRATDFGSHPNEFGTAKVAVGDRAALVGGLEVLGERSGAAPGTVLAWDGSGAVVATATHDVRLTGLTTPAGEPLAPAPATAPAAPWAVAAPLSAAATRAESAALRQERYWARRLGALRPAEPPYRDGAPAGDGELSLSVPVPAGARRAAADAGVSRQQWLLAATLAFLARTAREGFADVDLRVAGRTDTGTGHPVTDSLYAPYAPLRTPDVADGPSMAEFAREVAGRAEEVARRGPYPLDLWVRRPELRERRPAARGLPVAVELADPAGPATPAAPRPGTALLIRVPATGEHCEWVVRADAPARSAARELAGHAGAFLAAVAGPAGADLAAAPVCDDAARRRVLVEFNDTAADYPRHRCVHHLFAERAARNPRATAVTCGDTSLDYGELDRRSSALAGYLRSRGIGPGALVGVCLDRSAELLTALLGIMKSGAAYVPLDPIYPRDRIAHMLEDTGLPLVVTESALAAGLPAGRAETLVLDRDWPEIDRAAPERGAEVSAGDTAYVIYTSGSTGRPKGVRVGHRALVNFLTSMARTPGFTEADRLLAVTTICFDIAGLELYLPLIAGGQVEIAPTETAADGFRLRALLEERPPTVMQATPATWKMLIDAGWRGGTAAPRVWCGGEALPRDLAEALTARAPELWNLYGPTETTIWSAACRLAPGDPVTLGRPIANTQFYVLDERLRPVPPGVPGELYIGGDGLAFGYLRRPELTAERFVPNPFDPAAGALYRTGDLVRHLPHGALEYLGRVDNQVKLHGYRIELGEIEQELLAHPAVDRAVAVVREDEPGDRRLVAYIVPRGPGLEVARLREGLRGRLPEYMIPAAFVELAAVPLTANGKTDRKTLPRPTAVPATGAPPTAADSRTERAIAGIWREVLRSERVGAEDNFFEAGGNSLLLMRVMARLKDELRRPLTRVEMFKYPTIRAMARFLDAGRPEPKRARGPDPSGPRAADHDRGALGTLRRRRQARPERRPLRG